MSKSDALTLSQQFATSSPASDDWPGVSRSSLSASLVMRLNNPDLVHQRLTSLCGPASFVRAIALDMPLTYVRCAIDLYRTGRGNIVNLDIAPHRHMKRTPPKMGTDAADWIMMGSLRDDENLIFSVANAPGLVAGMTLPRAMVKWFKSAGYTNISDQAHLAWWPESNRLWAARYASNLHSAGYKVVMLIDADVLDPAKQDSDRINVPNHWVTLTSPILTKATMHLAEPVSFWIYSWGARMRIPANPAIPVTLSRFLQKFYGFVAAKL